MTSHATRLLSAEEVELRTERWRRFLQPGSPPGFLFRVACSDPAVQGPPAPPLWPDRRRERIEYLWGKYQRDLERAAWLDDDLVPSFDMITGTEIFAEALGCRVHRAADQMPFALPRIREAGEVASLRVPDLAASSLAYLFEMADELRRRAGPAAVLRIPDVQSPMDIAALVWDKSSFLAAMIEAPDAVKELAAKARDLLAAFLDEWFRCYGRSFVAHFPDYYVPRGFTVSEDEIGAVSPDTFEEFFFPELALLSARYGGIGMHCCASARHQWAGIRRVPGLFLLNLCTPPTVKDEAYTLPAFRYFAATCVQWHTWPPKGPVETWPGQFPADARVVIQVNAATRAEAEAACAKLNGVRERD
jgi:hypothetical protein